MATPENMATHMNLMLNRATMGSTLYLLIVLARSMEKMMMEKLAEIERRIILAIRENTAEGTTRYTTATINARAQEETRKHCHNYCKHTEGNGTAPVGTARYKTKMGHHHSNRRRRRRETGPGIGKADLAPSVPSMLHARQRRLLIKSVEKNTRIGAQGVTMVMIRDAVNTASRVRFAYKEFNKNDKLVLKAIENLLVEPALEDQQGIMKALNDLNIFGFDIDIYILTMNIVLNSITLGDDDWQPSDWNIDSKAWDDLEHEIILYNPGV
ncbi:hypothetical protein C7212DRAFT_340510 [Tuber magnatum]|uniref:Uncharacterized protein n=1 Tax=Tuber magnatum TaxID=42249 RepID=A0A317T0Y6_9PEZI|nr:hypothetical protein C7212DRAFT_340510 [Tuber magnatum]